MCLSFIKYRMLHQKADLRYNSALQQAYEAGDLERDLISLRITMVFEVNCLSQSSVI